MLQRLGKFAEVDHPGLDFTRLAQDIFEIGGPSGPHYCIVTKPQGPSLRVLQETLPNAILPKLLVKSLIQRLLFSVNWFHATCGVIHTGMLILVILAVENRLTFIVDISPQNVLMEIVDEISLQDVEEQESQNPSTPVISNGAPVYHSRPTMLELSGIPILTDFGQMRSVEPGNSDWWMPDLYRAPEVLLVLPWGYPVDMWSIGVMVRNELKTILKSTLANRYHEDTGAFGRQKPF